MRSDILNAVVSEEAAIGWLQDRGLIPLFMTCECEKKCKVVTRNELRCYRCPRSSCRKVYSFRYGTCFEKSKINFRNNIFLMYYWSLLTPVSTTVEVTSLSKCTVIDRYNFFRSICAHYFIDHPVRLGGPGRVVEIGQSMFGEARYRKGRQQVGHWVLGGIERGGGDCFLIEIADRTAETLLPIIAEYVLPETTVISDDATLHKIVDSLGMQHYTVQHKIGFVDPETGAHSQTIKSLWSRVKGMMRRLSVANTSRDLFATYLPEYMWRKKFAGDKVFDIFLEHIKKRYPLQLPS